MKKIKIPKIISSTQINTNTKELYKKIYKIIFFYVISSKKPTNICWKMHNLMISLTPTLWYQKYNLTLWKILYWTHGYTFLWFWMRCWKALGKIQLIYRFSLIEKEKKRGRKGNNVKWGGGEELIKNLSINMFRFKETLVPTRWNSEYTAETPLRLFSCKNWVVAKGWFFAL